MSLLARVVTEAGEELAPLIAPPIVIALVMAVILLALALVTYSYRDVANRHSNRGRPGDASSGQDEMH